MYKKFALPACATACAVALASAAVRAGIPPRYLLLAFWPWLLTLAVLLLRWRGPQELRAVLRRACACILALYACKAGQVLFAIAAALLGKPLGMLFAGFLARLAIDLCVFGVLLLAGIEVVGYLCRRIGLVGSHAAAKTAAAASGLLLDARFDAALAALQAGDSAPMRTMAEEERLGDAWLAVAQHLDGQHGEGRDELAIMQALAKALECRQWRGPSDKERSTAFSLHQERIFLGLGATPDYRELARQFTSDYFGGYDNEYRLAWIHACGPAELRDLPAARRWVAMGEARWGERDIALPGMASAALRALLEHGVPAEQLERIQSEAKAEAHVEWVALNK